MSYIKQDIKYIILLLLTNDIFTFNYTHDFNTHCAYGFK